MYVYRKKSFPFVEGSITRGHRSKVLGRRFGGELRKAQWLALLRHSVRDLGSIPASGDCLCGVCMFSLGLLVFPSVLRFPPTIQRCVG